MGRSTVYNEDESVDCGGRSSVAKGEKKLLGGASGWRSPDWGETGELATTRSIGALMNADHLQTKL